MKKSNCLESYEIEESAYTNFNELNKDIEYALKINGIFYRFTYKPATVGAGAALFVKAAKKNYIELNGAELKKKILTKTDLVNIRDISKKDD